MFTIQNGTVLSRVLRKTAVVSAAGSSFTIGLGIDPRKLAQ